MEENQLNINSGKIGLNLDTSVTDLQQGVFTYMLNGMYENFSGEELIAQNEGGNTLCFSLPEGYKVIGAYNITNLNKIVLFSTSPTSGDSQIGVVENCTYTTLVSDTDNSCKLNFSIHSPIRKIVQKTTNCSTQLYWTDGLNPRRYIDLDNLPWKEVVNPDNIFKPTKLEGQLDCNKLNVQPDFSVPTLDIKEVTVGGELITGTYQFTVQYANAFGDGYTSYYNVTNPVSIFEQKESQNFNLPTSKAIVVEVNDLDTSGLYEYFNLAVVKTINNTSTVELVGTFPISSPSYTQIYTGSEKSPIPLDIQDVFEKFPYYDTADDIFEVDNILGWASLKSDDEINYQQIWSKVKLNWETHQIPYNEFEAYNNGVNTAEYRGYYRDEVYAFEGCFLLKNGKQTKSFHIPGRVSVPYDLEISDWGEDNNFSYENPCDEPIGKPRWQVYNTASVIDYSPEYINKTTDDNCYKGAYQFGEFAYWESNQEYPRNSEIWGDLAGQKIRHHKFPDLLVSPMFSQNEYFVTNKVDKYRSFEHSIFPLGVKVDIGSLYSAIAQSNLTQAQKDEIVGFKILRGNRAANKSIIAKGLLNNVGVSEYDGQTYYYPNYPFNDLRKDPFYAKEKLSEDAGYRPDLSLNGFYNLPYESGKRFTFHSPDTHFYQPSLSNTGEYLKLEGIIYGKSYGHFVKVKDNAEYKFLTKDSLKAAGAIALGSTLTIGAGQFGSPTLNSGSATPTYLAANELFEKLVPYTNFGYSFNSTGYYGNFYPIPNNGNKLRGIEYNKYVINGINNVEEGNQLNNISRESSVYIKANESVKFPHDYDSSIPEDKSRFNLSSLGYDVTPDAQYNKIKYRFEIASTTSQFVTGATYIISGKEYIILSSHLIYQFRSIPPDYSGYLWLMPVDNTSIPPMFGGTMILSTTSTVAGPATITYTSVSAQLVIPEEEDYEEVNIANANKIRSSNISSYYGAIKRNVPGQWGQIYSYETIDTGYYQKLYPDGQQLSTVPTVFGGDIFINRFAYKSKLSFFRSTTVKAPNQTDVAYDEDGTVNYPMFWLSTKPRRFNIDLEPQLTNLIKQIDPSEGTFIGAVFRIISNISLGGMNGAMDIQNFTIKLFKQIWEVIGVKNINFDQSYIEGISEQGLMYMFSYGLPYYFCESEVNVDNRQATNSREGNFFPNVSNFIPDDWVQEVNVPIAQDNTYIYNQTYSKQNKENFYAHLREDFDPTKRCLTEFPNRVIWSDQSSVEENKNNWLIYRASSRYDLPKTYGTLTSIDNIEHRQLLVRYENKAQIYNALTTVEVSAGPDAYLGNSRLFSGAIPLDLHQTDIGYAGSQNQFILRTEYGQIYIDAKRGQVLLLNGSNLEDLAEKGLDKWFSEFLPFDILNYFEDFPIDNAFNGVGLHGVYDMLYKRVLITKKDYTPIFPDRTTFDGEDLYVDDTQVELTNSEYFVDKSWTLSFSFKTKSWTSFHSYVPNFYVAFPNYFYSGVNTNASVWEHNKTFSLYHNYYGTQYPYIVEYPYSAKYLDEIVQNIKDYTEARVYSDFYTYYVPDEVRYFNKAVIYNTQQCSGVLNLIPRQLNNLSQFKSYPKYNADSKDILVSKSDNFYNYNQFWNIVKNNSAPFYTNTSTFTLEEKSLINSNLDYSQRDYKKNQIRGKTTKVRLTLDNRSDTKLLSYFLVNQTSPSYK